MSRELARIQRAYFFAYYRRLGRHAAREATAPWAARLGTTATLAVLSFVFSWVFTGKGGFTSLAVALTTVGAFWLLVVLWFVVTIPPRIEREMQLKEQSLQVLTQRRNVANELRNHMVNCRMTAQQAREAEIQASGNDATVSPPRAETLHQVALLRAHDAEERLQWLSTQTGHFSYESQVIEISGAVNTKKVANVEEAIVQLEALADVLERQLSSGQYW
jgi:hypothetical protein